MAVSARAILLAALGALPVGLAPAWSTVGVWAAVVVALLTVDVVLAASPRRLTAERHLPPSVRYSQSTTADLTLVNPGGRTVRGVVRDAWQPSAGASPARAPLLLPAGESRRLRTTLRPTRRGDLGADLVTVRSFGPLGLAARQASLAAPARLRVLPEFRSRRHLPSRLARLREMDGRSAVRIRGQGSEFDSLRSYVVGDDVRAIDWRGSARRGEVVVRTWRPERDRRILIVLDTSRLSAARLGDAPRLDAQLEAVLLLAALAGHAGDRVEVVAVDRRIRAQVSGQRGPALLARLADALSPIDPALVELDWSLVTRTVADRLSQRGLVVLLTALEPAAVEHGLLPVAGRLTREHVVVLASAADPVLAELRSGRGEAHAVFAAAAAERTELERAAVAGALRRRGVEVVEAAPDLLAPALADAYLALKSSGRL